VENIRLATGVAGNAAAGKRIGKQRVMTCPKCRRPLPKCVICRKHCGSQAEPINYGDDERFINIPTAIDHWFVWCSHCNHGGHLTHVREWFNDYAVCPASGCDCMCMERDQVVKDDALDESRSAFHLRRSPSSLLDR